MRDFTSRTLNRTFKTIYFASALRVTGAIGPSKPDAVAAAALKTSNPNPQPLPTGGFTVEQLFTQASTLSGKQVTFRGKVVKYNAGIMGKNWMHIQDGTGAAASNTHDITVTTNASAAVGDFVVVKGMLVTDKTSGAGSLCRDCRKRVHYQELIISSTDTNLGRFIQKGTTRIRGVPHT